MFNLKKTKKLAQTSQEKYLRENPLGPQAKDTNPTWEKTLPHRGQYWQTTTEDQMKPEHNVANDVQIIEKVLNMAQSPNYTHRSDASVISVPPINVLVEKIRQNRLSEYTDKVDQHWSLSYDEKSQNGDLPEWPSMTGQHDKIVLNNDPRRFENTSNMPVHTDRQTNEDARSNTTHIESLHGTITAENMSKVAYSIKKGDSIDYDTAITAILKQADVEKRELTPIEQKAIVDLKVSRTSILMKK